MPLPPVETGPAAMTRRNYLVEMNRRRSTQYEPTLKQLEEDDMRTATARVEEKQRKQQEWAEARRRSGAASGTESAAERPIPGGGPRSRLAAIRTQSVENTYQLQKEEAAAKKREYNRIYDKESKRQLEERRETLQRKEAEDAAQMAALRSVTEEQDRKIAGAREQVKQEERDYQARLKESNAREQAAKKAEREAREARDRELQERVNENNRLRAEMDERRQKNVTRMLQVQNEEFHKDASKNKAATEAKHNEEMAAIAERNRRLAKEERDAAQLKKDTYKREFEEAIAREKEYRRTHNYDEPEEVARQRNETLAQSYQTICQEDRRREAEAKWQYKKELMEQIVEKQNYRMSHLDAPGM